MDKLKNSDRFRRLLKQFKPPSSNLDTTMRKSNREIKKPVRYESSPAVAVSKPIKRRVERKDETPKRKFNKNESRLASSRVSKRLITPETREEPTLNKRSPKRNAFQRIVSNEDQRPTSHTLQEYDCEPVRGQGVRTYEIEESRRQQNRKRVVDEDVMPKRMNAGCMPERRQQDFETSYTLNQRNFNRYEDRPDVSRRNLHTSRNIEVRQPFVRLHDVSKNPEFSMLYRSNLDKYSVDRQAPGRLFKMWQDSKVAPPPPSQRFDGGFLRPPTPPGPAKRAVNGAYRDGITKPRYVPYLPREMPNASRNYETFGEIREPVVRLHDISKNPDHSMSYRSRLDHQSIDRQPSGRLFKMWQNSKMAPPPPARFDGGFLHPSTLPGASKLAENEESLFLDTLTKFANCELFSTVENIFTLNRLEDRLIKKISETIRKRNSAQSSIMQLNMMETLLE